MKLTEELNKKLEKALYLKEGATIECPICHGIDWSVNPNIFEYPDFQFAQNRSPVTERVFPVIILVCEKCSYCIAFSAVELGLVLPDQENNQKEIKKKRVWNLWRDISFLKWFSNGTSRDKFILLLSYFGVFIGGVEVASNLSYSIILHVVSTMVLSMPIGWWFTLLGVILLVLSAYLIDVGSKNPLIVVNECGSISMQTSTKGTESLLNNKKLYKLGRYALVAGLIFSIAGLALSHN